MSDEQQRAPRISRGFMIRYRAAVHPAGWLVSPLRDLSHGGARFLAEQPFGIGDVLEAQLVLPASRAPVQLRATVAWIKPGPMTLTELGVMFQPVDPTTQHVIDAAVAHFLKRQGRGA